MEKDGVWRIRNGGISGLKPTDQHLACLTETYLTRASMETALNLPVNTTPLMDSSVRLASIINISFTETTLS